MQVRILPLRRTRFSFMPLSLPCVAPQTRAAGAEYVTPCSVLDITVSNAQLFEIQIV
jgi:hypothetical protein